MEPITISAIVAALAAGAAAAAKDTASSAIKDAYVGLKELIKRRFAASEALQVVVEKHEEKPDAWKAALEETLAELKADKDPEITDCTRSLLDAVAKARPNKRVETNTATASGRGVAAAGNSVAAGRDAVVSGYRKR